MSEFIAGYLAERFDGVDRTRVGWADDRGDIHELAFLLADNPQDAADAGA